MRVFSGIRPSGHLHLGNYFGAIKSWLSLQKENQCFFCIADLHALTTLHNPQLLRKYIAQTAADYLSLGVDPKHSILFVQSTVPQHTELAWILATLTSVSELKRMTQYKDKVKKLGASAVNAGLLEYPLLMASDILLYQTEAVPVGKDQQQHVELTRTLARRFNRRFGNTFIVPKTILSKEGASIKSLQNPRKKMSKTGSAKDCIFLSDSAQEIKKKIKEAVTDSGHNIKYDLVRKPGISNLINIYALIKEKPVLEIEQAFQDASYRKFKESLSKEIITFLSGVQKRREYWIRNSTELERILEDGRRQASSVAIATIKKTKDKLGLYLS